MRQREVFPVSIQARSVFSLKRASVAAALYNSSGNSNIFKLRHILVDTTF